MADAIGSLFVALGLDTAAFSAGVKQATKGIAALAGDMSARLGTSATNLGQKLSVVSAGMAALGGAALAAVNSTAAAGAEIARQANISNASATEFQLMAAAAKSVGIEQDQLAGILKDMNDRVGDFNATGAGPMADFFTKIAPKIGITANAFKGLSGPQALQLYVSSLEKAGLSQQEMTFYMEAIASESTALLPLLRGNGAEMARLGAAAAATGAIMSDKAIAASKGFTAQMELLKGGAQGLQNGLAESLMPSMTALLEMINQRIIPAMAGLVEKVGSAITWFTNLPAPVQQAAGVIALALGAGGPILLAIGAFATAVSGLIAATGPLGLFIAAASILASAWAVWGDDIKATVTSAIEAVKAKFNEILDWFRTLPAQMLEIGTQIVQGLMDGITRKWEELKAKIYGMAESLPEWAREALGIQSPSRVFREIGMWIMQGLGLGITDNISGVQSAMGQATDAIEKAGMEAPLFSFRDTARDVFGQVALEGKKLGDVLKSMAGSWLGNQAGSLFTAGFNGIWGALGLPSFANGTDSFRGGLARVNERGGEIMNLPRGTQVIPHDISKRMARDAAGAGGSAAIAISLSEGLEASILERTGAQTVQIMRASDRRLPDRMAQINKSPRTR